MKFKTKVKIFLAAVFLTFVAFNLMVSSTALEMMKVDKKPAYQMNKNVIPEPEVPTYYSFLG